MRGLEKKPAIETKRAKLSTIFTRIDFVDLSPESTFFVVFSDLLSKVIFNPSERVSR